MDYFPAATVIHGPVWKDHQLPLVQVLEANYPVIRSELEAILQVLCTNCGEESMSKNAENRSV